MATVPLLIKHSNLPQMLVQFCPMVRQVMGYLYRKIATKQAFNTKGHELISMEVNCAADQQKCLNWSTNVNVNSQVLLTLSVLKQTHPSNEHCMGVVLTCKKTTIHYYYNSHSKWTENCYNYTTTEKLVIDTFTFHSPNPLFTRKFRTSRLSLIHILSLVIHRCIAVY